MAQPGFACITSFGYLHGEPPPAHLILDLRPHLKDPAHTALRQLTGLDRAVCDQVFAVPGSAVLVTGLALALAGLMTGGHTPCGAKATAAIGCSGGRHRSVAVAEAVAHQLTELGWTVTIVHRDIDKPVIVRPVPAR